MTTEKPDSVLGAEAARRVDGLQNRVFLDPALKGSYPADVQADTVGATDWSFVLDGDLDVISAPIDVLGVNYYSPTPVRHWTRERPKENADGHGDGTASPWIACDDVEFPTQHGRKTDMGWSIDPRGLTELLLRVAREAPGLQIMVTENGSAFPDTVNAEGRIVDTERIDYLRTHLAAAHEAIEAGAPVAGYYVWSLLDNFEWAWGYAKRFGIVHVDYETQVRTLKDSALYYADVIRRNAVAR